MATLSAIRIAVKATLEAAIPALRVHSKLAEVVNLPAVVVVPTEAEYDVAFGRGLDTWPIDLYVLTSSAAPRSAQDALDAFVSGAGSSSIRQAIFNAKSLGLNETEAHVANMRGYGSRFDIADIDHIGAVLRLVVFTKGTE